MRKKQPTIEQKDGGWQPEGDHPLCPDSHKARLIVALDFAGGYRNVYACRDCQATRIMSGPRASRPWEQ